MNLLYSIEVIVNRLAVAGVMWIWDIALLLRSQHISVLYARVCGLDSALSSIVDWPRLAFQQKVFHL